MLLKMFKPGHLGVSSREQCNCKDEPHGETAALADDTAGDTAALDEGTTSFSSLQLLFTGGVSRVHNQG